MQTSRRFRPCRRFSCGVIACLSALPLAAPGTPSAKHALPPAVTIKIGGPHPRIVPMTRHRYEAISREAEATTRQGITAANARRKVQGLRGQ